MDTVVLLFGVVGLGTYLRYPWSTLGSLRTLNEWRLTFENSFYRSSRSFHKNHLTLAPY